MAIQGNLNGSTTDTSFSTPVYINAQLGAHDYPNGIITFDNISDGNAYWKNNNSSNAIAINMYLCDSAGNNRAFLFTLNLTKGGSSTSVKTATISGATGLMGKALYLVGDGEYVNSLQLRRYTTITINTSVGTYDIAGVGATGGSFTLDKYSAAPGETVTYTATTNTGYSASAPTSSPALTMTSLGNNKWSFTMPSSDVTTISTICSAMLPAPVPAANSNTMEGFIARM